jgi:nicotinamidase-related amidase/ketosteroid isomerase-like protein
MTSLTYEPELTGLLIVDPYNDFLSEGGKFYERGRETLQGLRVVAHMHEILGVARRRGIRIVIAPHHRWRTSDQHLHWKTLPPIQEGAQNEHAFADNTWGGTFRSEFLPQPGDVVAQEHWMSSGFANTDLDLELKKHGLRKLIVVGMRANTCIEATVRYAAELGYEVTVVNDAIGSFGFAEMAASLQFNMSQYACAVVSTADLLSQLAEDDTAKAVLDRHVAAMHERDFGKLVADYDELAVVIVNNHVFHGHDGVREAFDQIFRIFDGGKNRVDPVTIVGETIYMTWHFMTSGRTETFGTDSFFVVDGKIKVQTIASALFEAH